MPIKKAAIKDLRQNKKRKERNLKVKNSIKKMTVSFRKAITAKNKSEAEKISKQLAKAYDKAAQNGYLKKNTAARKKSRLMKKLNSLSKSEKSTS